MDTIHFNKDWLVNYSATDLHRIAAASCVERECCVAIVELCHQYGNDGWMIARSLTFHATQEEIEDVLEARANVMGTYRDKDGCHRAENNGDKLTRNGHRIPGFN